MIDTNKESKIAWEANAEFWDNFMGDESNSFHCDLVRPYTERLLNACSGELILDIACGNGNFSERLSQLGAEVVAFDYSKQMVEFAKKRRANIVDKVEFKVCDASNYDELIELAAGQKFDKAVANMAIMDISDIKPLFDALSTILKSGGIFVFSLHHPCFTYPNNDYLKEQIYKDVAIEGQPVLQNYYHRPIQNIFNLAFERGFSINGFHEIPFEGDKDPIIMIVRVCMG